VKRRSADGSVGSPHARVGNCQTLNKVKNLSRKTGVFCYGEFAIQSLHEDIKKPSKRMAFCASVLRN
ncbi:hypothetical protein, partial [Obesumbacterium proteus]|uniref:hypothetical protein n=1 Tax=Obesumbacterium proteus TaxID=82983 RepID=UPI001D0F4C4D